MFRIKWMRNHLGEVVRTLFLESRFPLDFLAPICDSPFIFSAEFATSGEKGSGLFTKPFDPFM